MRNWLIFLFALLLSATTRAQSDTHRPDWKRYDSMLLKKMMLENTRQSIDSLRRICLSQERYAEAARSWQYLIAIDDARTEDTLFFFNSYPIDSVLLREDNPVELQFCFQLMQAQRLKTFETLSLKFAKSKYQSPRGSVQFATLGRNAADSLIAGHFEAAMNLAREIPANEYRQLLWLSNDPSLFLFEPTAFDIAMGNYIPWKATRSGWEFSESVRENTEWRNWSPDQMTQRILWGDSNWLTANETVQLYGRWMQHWKQNRSTRRYLESLLRKWLNHKVGATPGSPEWLSYNRYLQAHVSEPFAEARMHAALQLAQRWTSRADQYLPVEARREPSWYYGYGSNGQQYDTLARLYADSALLMWKGLAATADSFPLVRQLVETILIPYRSPSIRFRMPKVQLPDEPLLVEAIYRHAPGVQLLVYRVGLKEQQSDIDVQLQQLPEGEPVWKKKLQLPDAADANEHLAFLKMEGLPAGRYRLYVVYDSLISAGKWSASSEFQVSTLQVLQENNKVFVLNRKTGQAIAGARAKLYAPKSERLISSARTNRDGLVEMKSEKAGRLQVSFGLDSIQENFDPEAPRLPDEVFSRNEYENRLEFYDDNTVVHVYLDRGIYRPGDTVFYKAILLTREPKTGEWMIVNKRNLSKGRLFSLYQKMMHEAEPWLFVQDPFGNERDSLQIELNDFGSQAGRFIIPLTAPTGEWEIESDYFDQEGGSFRVEEYKRPSYELTINKPVVPLLPGDSFSFEVKLRSFSGAPMGGVNIGYRITRSDNAANDWTKMQKGSSGETVIQDATAQSSTDGSLSILVSDSIWKNYFGDDRGKLWLRYSINVRVTDATGETYEESSVCTVMAQPISINTVSNNELVLGKRSALQFRLNHVNAGTVKKAIRVRIRRDADGTEDGAGYRAIAADQFLYPKDSLAFWFGELLPQTQLRAIDSTVLIDTLLPAASPTLQLAQTGLPPGTYHMQLNVSDTGRLLGETTQQFKLFSTESSNIPVSSGLINLEVAANGSPGEKMPVYSGSNESSWSRLWHYRYFDNKGRLHEKYEWMQGRPGLQEWTLTIPVDASGSIYLTGISVRNNRVYEYSKRIQVLRPTEKMPEVVIERYRQSLTPGATERFEVSVQERDAPVLAELMTTLYDASLDQLEELRWNLSRSSRELRADANWQTGVNSFRRSVDYLHGGISSHTIISQGEMYVHGSEVSKPLFWYNPLDYNYADDMPAPFRGYFALPYGNYDIDGDGVVNAFAGWMPGIAISSASGLDEVVVVGYGAAKRLNSTGAVSSVTLRGISSLNAYSQPLILLDGVVFTGDLSSIDPATIVSGLVLKGAEGAAIFGARAAQGVLLLSTKGEIQLPLPAEIPVVSRKNFAASAFFFPQLRANKQGRFVMSFTMPESVTEWKWKLLAHTRDARFAYLERTLRSSLPLMVQSALPRFVYAGDSIVLSCRISNLDSVDQSGVAMLQVLDSANNPIADLSQKARIELSAGSSTVVEFPFKVKPQQLDQLSIRMLARTEYFADGEEHLLPVLQKELWVQYPQDFQFNAKDTSFTRPASICKEKWMGTAVSVKKQKAAELFDGLSYLSSFELDCAEQLTNKIFADLQAWRLLQKDTLVQKAFARLEASVAGLPSKETPDELPGQKSMPWLSLMESEAEQAHRKWNLLDTSRIQTRVEQNFTKLFKLQQSDAGLAWFPGGESDAFISAYVLRKLGSLKADPNWNRETQEVSYQFQAFKGKLLKYLDTLLLKAFNRDQEQLWLSFVHARSYWLAEQPLDGKSRKWVLENLSRMAGSFETMELDAIAMLAVAYKRFDSSEKAQAQCQLLWDNLIQRSIRDAAGMRWREISNSPTSSAQSEEQLLLMAEAIKLFSTDTLMLTDVARWLMDARQQRNWRSTRSQSAFIELIQMARMPLWKPSPDMLWSIAEGEHRVSSNPLNNLGQKFSRSPSARDKVHLIKDGEGTVAGRVTWHYLTDKPEQLPQGEKLRLTQNWLRWNDSTSDWQPIGQGERLNLGQKIACQITIDALEPISYVQLESYHPACASPIEMLSEYRYGKNWRYYQSVHDERIDLFAGKLPEGRSSVLFEFRVEKKGVFQFRPAVVRAMYEMGVEAYGRAGEVLVQ